MHRLARPLKTALVATAGIATALGVAALSQSASGSSATTPTKTSTTATTKTSTTPTKTTTPTAKVGTRKVTCRAALVAARPPLSSAENFGTLTCSSPLGKGVHHDRSKITRTSQTAGTFSGSFKLFFNEGTLRGRLKMAFEVNAGKASYDGTMTVTSGTGDLKGWEGDGTITGASDDLIHTPVTERLTLTAPGGGSG